MTDTLALAAATDTAVMTEKVAPTAADNNVAVSTAVKTENESIALEDKYETKKIHKLAAALRAKYKMQPKPILVHPFLLGFHRLNRNGLPPNGDRVDQILQDILVRGYIPEEAAHGCVAMGRSRDDRDNIRFCVDAVEASDGQLASFGPRWDPIGFCIAHTHLCQMFRNILGSATSSIESLVDCSGRLSFTLVESADAELARDCKNGLPWELLDPRMEEDEPGSVDLIQAAFNLTHGAAMMNHEMQGLQKLCAICAAESDLCRSAERGILFDVVRDEFRKTFPALAGGHLFSDLFNMAISYGGTGSPYMDILRIFLSNG
jgi:hypothetical protein